MKHKLLLSFLGLIVGILIGYQLPHPVRAEPAPVVVLPAADSADPEPDAQIQPLSMESENLSASLPSQSVESTPVPSEESIRKKMLKSIIEGENLSPEQAAWDRKQFNLFARSLNLTPDQITQLELLWGMKMKQMRLISQTRGLLSIEERQSMYGDMMEFRFDNEVKKILTDQQATVYEEKKQKDRETYSIVQTERFLTDLQIAGSSQFNEQEHAEMKDVLQKAYSSSQKIEIPDSIRELQIRPDNKRILAHCYRDLSPELFEKVYESIVEYESQ